MSTELGSALAKIRSQTSSSLAHQNTPANLLKAVEATLEEQSAQRSPAAYFSALLSILESTIQKEKSDGFSLGDSDILPAELYLLALVTPFVPSPIIRTNLDAFLSLTTLLWPSLNAHAPPLRSQLSLYNGILNALDRSQLEVPAVRQSFASILQLCVDARPNVRKKAVEVVRNILSSPPSPMLRHPYAEKIAEWSLKALAEVNAGGVSKQKGKRPVSDASAVAIHLLAFLRPILPYLPSETLPSITVALLSFPRLGNPYLSQSAYSVLSALLSTPSDDMSQQHVNVQSADILKAILSLLPSKADLTILPAWVHLVGKAMLVHSTSDADACADKLAKVWKVVFTLLESNDSATRKATAESLASLTHCITPTLIISATEKADPPSGDATPALMQMILMTTKALDSLAFARAIPELFAVISALIFSLRHRVGGQTSPTAAESLLLPLIQKIGELRIRKEFGNKEAADGVLQMAMSVMGPEVLLRALPLNLEPADRAAGQEPRAFLLPMLTSPHPSPLSHFISYFVPLTERMFDLQQQADSDGRTSEAKMWSVLVSQIWNGLPAYCHSTRDLREALTPQFAQLLSQLLYDQADLRPGVLKSLKILVESNLALSQSRADQVSSIYENIVSEEEATRNIDFLRNQAESWFAVLFNVFGSTGRDGQSMVGDVISTWASIADEQEMARTCSKVVNLLKTDLAKTGRDQTHTVAIMQDILVLLVPYLLSSETNDLFNLCSSREVLTYKDNGVQKRGYKLLSKIVQNGKTHVDAEHVFRILEEFSDETAAAAKKDRITLLKALLPHLPSTSLHVIPSLIPEAVLGTKEPSEKARIAAFDLVVAMGQKMSASGIVRRDQVNGMDDDGVTEVSASIEEYLTMIAGGLAGASPHMISATITAISRIVFEFKDDISPQMHTEIFTTHLVFLSSANREIVKSTLGFIKLAVHTLPEDIMRPHLNQLVSALLSWSHDHKNHFKAKVRHIFERMIRRFGWDDVYACVGEEEAGKVLLNIKKRKDRAKRKKAQATHDGVDGDDEETIVKPVTGDAFEDVLYGSESDLDDSDGEDQPAPRAPARKRKTADGGMRLRMDDDNPTDLLQDIKARLTSLNANLHRKPGQEAVKFKTDENTGKMIIDDDSDSDMGDDFKAREDVEGTAYRESFTSVDGFTRGPSGRVKFNKDTKKRRRENEETGSDIEMTDVSAGTPKKSKRNSAIRLGREFKAKKAGGDVKKGGLDPYAYLPLAQAAKKGGNGRHRVTVTGKR